MFKASEGVVDNLTWNNINIFLAMFWFVAIGIRVKRDRRGHSYFVVRGEILGFTMDEQKRKHLTSVEKLIAVGIRL